MPAGEPRRAASLSGGASADAVAVGYHAYGAGRLELLGVVACGDGHSEVDDCGAGQGEGNGRGGDG